MAVIVLDLTQVLDLSKWERCPQLDYMKAFAHVLKNEGFWMSSHHYDMMDSELGWFDRVYVLRIDGTDISEFPIFAEYDVYVTSGVVVEYYVQPASMKFVEDLLNTNNYKDVSNGNDKFKSTVFADYKLRRVFDGNPVAPNPLTFDCIDDLVTAIMPLFGDYVDQYDIESIALDMGYWYNGKYYIYPMYNDTDDEFDQLEFNMLLIRHANIKVVKV